MSYDLYFYKKSNSELTLQDIEEYIDANIPHTETDESGQRLYWNDATEAHFALDFADDDEEDDICKENPDFETTGLSFSINFIRPYYFGLEIFPIIEEMVEKLDLYVFNPQNSGDDETPQKYRKDELRLDWSERNDRITIRMQDQINPIYFPREKLNQIWKYLYGREELQKRLGENVYASGYFFLQNRKDGKISTATTWTEHIPVVLPPVDYVIIQKRYKRFFKTVKEDGLVTYSELMEKFGKYFKPFEGDMPGLKIMTPEFEHTVAKEFNKLKIWKSIKEFGPGIGKSSLVDIKTGSRK
jgi:hypothetical protein